MRNMYDCTVSERRISGEEITNQVRDQLTQRYGEEALQSWFRHITFASKQNGIVTLAVPSKFLREWITVNYYEVILGMWQAIDSSVCTIEFCTRESTPNTPAEQAAPAKAKALIHSPVDGSLNFDNFVVALSNEVAFAACQRVSSLVCPDKISNPLFLYGGVGLGKTHLMHAIAHSVSTQMPWKKVLYLTAENFMRHFINALRDKNSRQLQEELRSVDILLIDDVQFIGGKEYTQEEFFHTFNDLIDSSKQVVISADRLPSDLEHMKERIKSRLSGGLVVDVSPTTFELRMGILKKKSEKIALPDAVLEYLANTITANVRELEGAMNRLMVTAEIQKRVIDLEFAKEVISGVQAMRNATATPEKITRIVASFYGIKISDMISPKKDAKTVRARQVAMYIIKKLSDSSLAEIGKNFGGRNHTTVMYAVKKVEDWMAEEAFAEEVDELLRKAHS